MADSIRCPDCRAEIPLTDAIGHQIEEQLKAQLALELAVRERQHAEAAAAREAELRREFEEAQREREALLRSSAERKVATDLADLGARVEEQQAELEQARQRELELRQQKRKLDEEKQTLDLELARRLDEERTKIAAEAREGAADEHRMQLRQKELEVEQMKKQIKDLQESSEQMRSGLRGEAQEREIEDVLRERFRADRIEPVKAGIRGADVLQTIVSPRGQACGTILWESKRARNWSNGWIGKLKEDQAAAGADIAVLVCTALPPNVKHMELYEGVWVAEFGCLVAMASALRQGLIGVTQARSIDANRNDALDEIYDYLSSAEFGRRIHTAVQAFVDMKSDLDTERRAMERMWNKRSKQLDALTLNTAGMYGELEALMGSALPSVEMLELPAPPVPLRSAS
jgi:hypothetical protein